MRVYFAPCGIGLGHVGRCTPIARANQRETIGRVRRGLQMETGERLAHIQEEALKHNGLKNAVRTVVQMAEQ